MSSKERPKERSKKRPRGPKKKAEEVVCLTPEEVLCAIGEYVRRHHDTRGGRRFSYHVQLVENGGAMVGLGPRPSRKRVAEWEAAKRVRWQGLH